jgi:hypothetical protein
MKTKLSYIVSALISLVLCAAMLCGAVFSATADGVGMPSLNYDNPAIDNPIVLSAYDLYTMLLEGGTPTAGEKMYLESSDVQLTYTDFIPESCINTQYDGERGVLYVTVIPYTYHAANGSDVTWIPKNVVFNEKTYSLINSNDVYSTTISNCYETGDFHMQVEFSWRVELPKEIISHLCQEAYEKGYAAHLLMEDYRKELADYQALVDIKENWDAYIQWEEDYANYVVQKAIYDELKANYDAYMVKYNAYQAELDAYNQWQNYFAQEEAFKQNQEPYAQYVNYYKQYKAAVDKLAMFDSVYLTEPRGWCMYTDIMGGTVTEVLSKQDLLIAGGCNADDIHLAGRSTENLRVLLKGYADLRGATWKSEYEKYKALYTYYTENYDALTQNLCDLYRTLKGLYENTAVSNLAGLKGITVHYRQLVGHLFVVSTALDTTATRNEDSWRMDKKKLIEVIDPMHYFPDGDWDPRTTAFPATEVPYVERVEEPVKPTVVNPGVMPSDPPEEVKNPGDAPAVVENPAGTPRPQEPLPIGPKPQEPVLDAAVVQLYKDFESGLLKPFSGTVGAETLTLTKTISREVSIKNIKTVTLYHPDGSIYKQIQVESGKGIDKLEPYPFADADGYDFVWLRWARMLPNGDYADVNLDCITENIALYPLYRATPKIYTVTWVIDGVSYATQCYFGQTPDPNLYIYRYPYEDAYHVYSFSGWDHEIEPVKGDTTYVGSTVKSPKKFKITWVIENGTKSITEEWEYNKVPTFAIDDFYLTATSKFTFWTWDREIAPVTRDITYTARYKETPLASASGDVIYEIVNTETEMTVLATKPTVKMAEAARLADELGKKLTICWEGVLSITLEGEELKTYIAGGCLPLLLTTQTKENEIFYDFEYFNLSGKIFDMPCATVRFESKRANGRETVFEVKTANGWECPTDATFVAEGDFSARCRFAYSVRPQASEFCNVAQMVNKAIVGEWVSLDLNCVYGYKIVGAKVTDANGAEIPLTGLSFQMPASTVSVVLQIEQIVYNVTFIVDGTVWHSAQYHAGDEILLPENPTKAAEGDYTYTFTGWGNVPALATGENTDMVFEASWVKSQLVSDYDSGHNNNVLFGVVLPCVLAAVVLVIVFFILRKKARKMGGWRILGAKIRTSLHAFFQKIKGDTKKTPKENENKQTKK